MNFKSWLLDEAAIKSNESSNSIELSYMDTVVKGYLHAQQDEQNPKLFRVIRVTVSPQGQGYGKGLYLEAIRLATKRGAM